MWIIKTPFYTLLYLFYDLPLSSFFLNNLIDSTSLALAFVITGITTRANYPPTPSAVLIAQERALSNTLNAVLTILLSACISALSVKIFLLDILLPKFFITSFYPFESLHKAHNVSLFELGALFMPLAIALRMILFARPTVFFRLARFWWSSTRTKLVRGRQEVVFLGVLIDNGLRIATTVGGASWEGAVVWALAWGGVVDLQSVVLAWVEAGVEVDGMGIA
jgi:hypothetical protein